MPDAAAWRGRRVLVTGHTGFKGAWLVLWLHALGARVTGFSAAAPPTSRSVFEDAGLAGALERDLRGDVRDPVAVRAAVAAADAEVVLHLAAQAIVRTALRDPAATYATNVVGTANVLQALRDPAPRAVVVVTSDKCYRDVESGRPMREDDALGGRDPYSASKAAQELVVAAERDTALAERGVAVATARAGNVIGGGDRAADRLVPDLVAAARDGEPLVLRNPAAVRPWQHVLNPLSGYLTLAERLLGPDGDAFAQAWNFGPGPADERSVEWVVDRFRERWPGAAPDVRVQPDPDAGKESALLRLDSSKARERLGWTPRWDLERAIDATIEWYAAGDARAVTERQIDAFARDRPGRDAIPAR